MELQWHLNYWPYDFKKFSGKISGSSTKRPLVKRAYSAWHMMRKKRITDIDAIVFVSWFLSKTKDKTATVRLIDKNKKATLDNIVISKSLQDIPTNIRRRATVVFWGIKSRCENEKSSHFKYYGAKGIRVEIEKQEFVRWYFSMNKKHKGRRFHVGRKNHDQSYTISNIEAITPEANLNERIDRCGPPPPRTRKIVVLDPSTKALLRTYSSINEAASALNLNRRHIDHAMRKRRFVKKYGPYFFMKYEDYKREQ